MAANLSLITIFSQDDSTFLLDVSNVFTTHLGNYNEKLLKDNCLLSFIQNAGNKKLSSPCPTTPECTQIKNIFGNISYQTGIYTTLFSYRKPIWARI